jgi:subtilisin family serine protease
MLLLIHQQLGSHIVLALFHLAVTITLQVQVSTTTELVRLFLCCMTFLTLFRFDTGIYIENNDFGERAYWGATFGGYTDQDGNGHGTAAASSAVGNNRGTATGSNAYAVKVFSDEYQANTGDAISGIQRVITAVSQLGRPSVMDLGFSLAPSDALNQAVQSAIDASISVTTATGDDGADAGGYSPGQGEWFLEGMKFQELTLRAVQRVNTWAISTLATLCTFFILHLA